MDLLSTLNNPQASDDDRLDAMQDLTHWLLKGGFPIVGKITKETKETLGHWSTGLETLENMLTTELEVTHSDNEGIGVNCGWNKLPYECCTCKEVS